jgi:hypothetical protein
MIQQDTFGLPRDLGNGLLLRWATPEDADELARFNVTMHSDDPNSPQEWLGKWTHDLMDGTHPTTKADDFTVVVDTNDRGRIVSSLNLISQVWAYDGLPFGVGRPELVATHPDYRRRGLVRAQMGAVHAKSAERGELVQVITGIPWYYRQFGYDMALNLGGGRSFFWVRQGNNEPVEEERYRLRRPTYDDIPLLQELYRAYCANGLITLLRDEAIWRYEVERCESGLEDRMNLYLVETVAADVVGYVDYFLWGTGFGVHELGVLPGHSWRAVCLFLTRYLKGEADRLNPSREKPATDIYFNLGEAHPAYEALGRQLEKQARPYAFYVRVPDLFAFLRHVMPILEKRLASSVMAGHSGNLKLNLYRQTINLSWEGGRLQSITPFETKNVWEGDVLFPDLTFLEMLFGYRSFEELHRAWADCYANSAEAEVLINILFPRRPSHLEALG